MYAHSHVRARHDLASRLDALEAIYGRPRPPVPRDPFEFVLWENVAYLVDDERRAQAFAELERAVGTKPAKIRDASHAALLRVARLGGMHPERRIERLVECAEIALADFGGDLRRVLALPAKQALKALKKFPGIGEPGAEKILLLSGALPVLALDSNGLRVLLRLGYGKEQANYAASYRCAREAVLRELVEDTAWLARAHELLRTHGRELCKTKLPDCDACPLASGCAHAS